MEIWVTGKIVLFITVNAGSESELYVFYLQFLFLWQPSKIGGIITIYRRKKSSFRKS